MIISLHINNIKRGNNYILDFENTWDESLPNIIENCTTVHIDWSDNFFANKLNIRSRLGYSWIDNYHHVVNEYFEYPEFWLNINYRLFLFSDI